jgi:serine/threonine protein kinase
VLRLTPRAARGLAAAHRAGVIHRDIKPDNILVGTDGRARVTDFGLARLDNSRSMQGDASRLSLADIPSLTRPGMLLGTPSYMAPEQLAGGDADARTDQWSFCMTLYEALAGVRPFGIVDLAARASAIRASEVAPPASGRCVPGYVRRIVMRGLRADPVERWPSIDAIVEALARGRARRWRSSSSMWQTARRRRRPAADDHVPKVTASNSPSASKPPPILDGEGIPKRRWRR